MNIEIEVIKIDGIGESALVSMGRTEGAAKKYRKRAARLKAEGKKASIEEATRLDELATETIAIAEELRSDNEVELRTFPFTPYTYGQKLEAAEKATDYETGSPRLNGWLYDALLVEASTGVKVDDFKAMAPKVAEMLLLEVKDRSEPDPGRLDFLHS